jgi:hypothetical protein
MKVRCYELADHSRYWDFIRIMGGLPILLC